MARIRSIKPEFPQSESMGRISRDARLLFVMLFTVVDDAGITRGNSRMLASLLFPYDDDASALIEGWFSELESESCVVRYLHDGQHYLQICNWLNHQKIDKPTPSKLPAFDSSREDSRILPVGEEGKGEEGKGKEGNAIACPTDKIVELYHQLMPDNPHCKAVNVARRKSIKARWDEAAKLTCEPFGYETVEAGLIAWKLFFEVCSNSKFLTGQCPPSPGRTDPFFADIDFLFSPSGFIKCLENKYHRDLA